MKKILFLISFFLTFNLYAQEGLLDSSFAGNGIYLNQNAVFRCDALQKTGKIIIAGSGTNEDIAGSALVRYNQSGIIDSSFGKNGYAIVGFDVANQGAFRSVAILDNDEIIAASEGPIIFLAKFTKDGKLDSSFGINGCVQNRFSYNDGIFSMQIQTDGKIIVAGDLTAGFSDPSYALVARYLPDGTIDINFGDSGRKILPESIGLSSVVLQKDGKIVIGGIANAGDNEFYVGRLTSGGNYDESFENKGYVLTRFFENRRDGLESLTMQPDGKILAAGYCNGYFLNQDIGVARYNVDGSLDNSFGEGGLKAIHINNAAEATTVIIQRDNNIILSGRTYNDEAFRSDAVLIKLHTDASPDSTFGVNGISITDLSNGGYDSEYGAILQTDGKIIVSGQSDMRDGSNYGNVARFNNTDESQKQIIITKIRHWIQHHNGIEWDNVTGASSYTVQRSYDGVHFSSIARITASNHSNYTYADPSPLSGTNYYRLQTTSISNAVTNSNVIAVTSDNNTVTISPNPASSSLHIDGLSSTQKTKLTVVDFNGNVKMQMVANASSYNLNIGSLHAGNYILKIETNGEVVTKQFVKQ